MSAPTQSNTAYKKRLISAMLQESALHNVSVPAPKPAKTWSFKFASGVAGLALLSATAVFLILFHRDASRNRTSTLVGVSEQKMAASSGPAEAPIAHDAAKASVAPVTAAPDARASVSRESSAPVSFEFKLTRSRAYQHIGTIEMRLLRMNLRRRTCDVAVRLADGQTLQKRAPLNKPVQLRSALSSEVFELSISTIARDSVTGTLSPLSAASNKAEQRP
ncbi:MAG: hypothetical protein ACJ74Y_10460 [Bryobacteraceae bacterium]